MEERNRQCVKEDSYEDRSAYNIAGSKSEENVPHMTDGTQSQVGSLHSTSKYRSPSEGSRQQCVKTDSNEDRSACNITDSKNDETVAYKTDGTELQARGLNRNSERINPSEGSRTSTTAAPEEVLRLDHITLELS